MHPEDASLTTEGCVYQKVSRPARLLLGKPRSAILTLFFSSAVSLALVRLNVKLDDLIFLDVVGFVAELDMIELRADKSAKHHGITFFKDSSNNVGQLDVHVVDDVWQCPN